MDIIETHKFLSQYDMDNLTIEQYSEITKELDLVDMTTEAMSKTKGVSTTELTDKVTEKIHEAMIDLKDTVSHNLSNYINNLATEISIAIEDMDKVNLPSDKEIESLQKNGDGHKITIDNSVWDNVKDFFDINSTSVNTRFLKAVATMNTNYRRYSATNKFNYYVANKPTLRSMSVKYHNRGRGKALLATCNVPSFEPTTEIKTKIIHIPEIIKSFKGPEVSCKDLDINIRDLIKGIDVEEHKKVIKDAQKQLANDIKEANRLIELSNSKEDIKKIREYSKYLHERLNVLVTFRQNILKDSVYLINKFS